MGKYFENASLDDLWDRLVTATTNLIGSNGKQWVLTPNVAQNAHTFPYISGEYLCSSDSSWCVVDVEDINLYERFFDMSNPIPLADLNTERIYRVYGTGAVSDSYTLKFDMVERDSVKDIHDALVQYFNLQHITPPTTPGDYMKGISVAANYYTNNYEMDSKTENTLKRIVDRLEHSCYLSDDMVLTINGWFHLSGFRLIDADTEEELCYIDSGSSFNYDIKDYYDSFQNGKRYYAIADLTMEENIEADQPPDIWYYNIRSNEVVFGGESTGSWKLTDLSDSASFYNMRIADGYLLVDGDPWAVFDNDDNVIATLYSDTPVDLSSLDTGKSYYVSFSDDGATPGAVHARLVYEAEGGDTEKWLFKDEYIDATLRQDLPLPVSGQSYTAFVDGVEIGTATAGTWNVQFTNDNMQLTGDFDIGHWSFSAFYSVTSGMVSIRINESEGGNTGGTEGDTEGGDETGSWVLEVVPGSKPGNIWLEGGYLYTDGEFGYYVQEQNWTTSKVYFYPGEPLDLSTLDKNLTYRVEDGDVNQRWGTLWYER